MLDFATQIGFPVITLDSTRRSVLLKDYPNRKSDFMTPFPVCGFSALISVTIDDTRRVNTRLCPQDGPNRKEIPDFMMC